MVLLHSTGISFKLMSHGPKQIHSRLIKTIIIGQVSVGKSSLILKYADRKNDQPHATIGIDILMKKINHHGKSYSLQLWDTAGHERYRTVVYNYFSHAQAAIVVFDLTDEASLDEATIWMQQICLHCDERIPKMLLGNKSDLFDREELTQKLESYKGKIEKLKKEFNCEFYPVSAATGANLDFSFVSLLEKAVQLCDRASLTQTIKLKSSVCHEKLYGKIDRCC